MSLSLASLNIPIFSPFATENGLEVSRLLVAIQTTCDAVVNLSEPMCYDMRVMTLQSRTRDATC